VQYKCTDYYAPSCDGNIAWNDPEISIDWGVDPQDILLSPKDEKAPFLKDFKSPF
jgi:dTDP-4-dehydrorhamnose 3,5-epimerase